MFEWFSELPKWLKFAVAFLILGISAGLHFSGLMWIWGWGIGLTLLVFAIVFD